MKTLRSVGACLKVWLFLGSDGTDVAKCCVRQMSYELICARKACIQKWAKGKGMSFFPNLQGKITSQLGEQEWSGNRCGSIRTLNTKVTNNRITELFSTL